MNAHPILISVSVGYLLGSIPFGYMLVRVFRGADVRETGSGNIGATNVARMSPLLGLATLLLDAAKGSAAVLLVLAMFSNSRPLGFIAAFAAICGHIFPVWLTFRGGKGVATGLGAFLLLTPKAILLVAGVFVIMAALFRMVALASIFAVASLPLAVWLCGESRVAGMVFDSAGFSMAIISLASILASAALIITKHHTNIRRMLAGTEPKFQFPSK